ncbi:MAG: hypothetical protein A2W05_05095 [Candidatus Schekmanbacteria bacterium RBG_16_38_10]|uniref:Molecular chaperone Skp n=1 Tax=Candidatus Schekmanbacteria bacterium RBG_16_38_10 TaxID=1817879 RepID=A0A1F7RVJ9_9BACT|nr:MAG: hypothetical protein A2W05_05095 [Candidatus Schekmanbacteria bacterium RBG_16_38_10]
MKNISKIFMFLLIIAIPQIAFAESSKIGVVDLQKVLNESAKGKEAVKLLEVEFEKKKKELDIKENDIKKLEEEISKRGSLWSEKVKQEKEEDYDKKVKDYRRLQTDLKDEFQRKNKNFTDKILSDIIELVRTVGDEEKFSLIMEKQNAIFTSSTIDITDKVIKLYNGKEKGEK